MSVPESQLEALRPKSLQELHQSVAEVNKGRKRGPPPAIVAQLQSFCEQRALCEKQCFTRLRAHAVQEATLVPAPESADDSASGTSDAHSRAVAAAVTKRYAALEPHCVVMCGRRLVHLVSAPS